MGKIETDHTGSGGGITLSSDGTSLLLDGTAIGGGGGASAYTIDSKSASYTVVAGDLGKIIFMSAGGSITLPSAATIGSGFWVVVKVDNSNLTSRTSGITLTAASGSIAGVSSFVLDVGMSVKVISNGTDYIVDRDGSHMFATNTYGGKVQARATGNRSIAIGDNALAQNNYSTALGKAARATGTNSLAIGSTNSQTNATGTASTAIGANSGTSGSQSSGSGSMALGGSYASGTNSFAAAIANNNSSYGALGTSSVVIGSHNKAASGSTGALVLGRFSLASVEDCYAIGSYCTASGYYSMALGRQAVAQTNGKMAFSNGRFATNGDAQTGKFVLKRDTTDATPEALTTNNGTANATSQVVLPNNSVYGFTGTIIARENSAQTNDFAVWEVKGGAVRAASAATTALGSYNINKISESTGAANWSIAISADTTNGAIAFTVTGEASHSIRWVATINTTEVTY